MVRNTSSQTQSLLTMIKRGKPGSRIKKKSGSSLKLRNRTSTKRIKISRSDVLAAQNRASEGVISLLDDQLKRLMNPKHKSLPKYNHTYKSDDNKDGRGLMRRYLTRAGIDGAERLDRCVHGLDKMGCRDPRDFTAGNARDYEESNFTPREYSMLQAFMKTPLGKIKE